MRPERARAATAAARHHQIIGGLDEIWIGREPAEDVTRHASDDAAPEMGGAETAATVCTTVTACLQRAVTTA